MGKQQSYLRRVEIAPAVPLSGKRQTYTYHIAEEFLPDDDAELINTVVSVTFGPRRIAGVILSLSKGAVKYPTKAVTRLTPVQLTNRQIEFGRFLAETMQGGLGFTLRLFLPSSLTRDPSEKLATKDKPSQVKAGGAVEDIGRGTYAYIEKNWGRRFLFLKEMALQEASLGRQALIVMPEKWMVERMADVFDEKDERIAFFHAGLKGVEQTRIWHQLKNGQVLVVVGTQKTLFLPWQNLNTIVIEEEQLSSHKLFDQYPRLHNVAGVKQLQKIHGAALIYTSSFPSLSLYYGMVHGNIKILRDNPLLVKPRVVNSSFADRQQKQLLPHEFAEKLRIWLRKKEKVMVLYNQRGSWQSAHCRSCGKAVSCPDCLTALTIHGAGKKKLQCHQCGFTTELPEKCPRCRKGSLKYIGIGTEIVEHVLNQLAPWRKDLVRIDTDTVKNMTDKKIQQEIDSKHLVMGTSALFTHVKDRQFDRVVWLFPERGLQYPDFRSYERSYLLLARLKSRAKSKQKVTVVTRNPLLVEAVFTEDMPVFYDYQLKERKRLKYPPYRELVRLTVTGKTPDGALLKAGKVRVEISKRLSGNKEVLVRGPFQGFQRYRKQKAEVHIVLLGTSLSAVTDIYAGLPVDTVDLDPQRII